MTISTNFSIEEVKEQMTRILQFPTFRNSPVLSRFLEYIVLETVVNKAGQIKEYAIAIHVLYRSRNFNPNIDSIVRIHAGRLRRILSEYYLTQGMYDPIIINIPKGCYVPEFSDNLTAQPTAKRLPPPLPVVNFKPLVALFPFRIATKRDGINELHLALKEHLSEELLTFPDVSVVGYYSLAMTAKISENILEAGKLAGADYIITGSVEHTAEHVRVLINLVVTETGELLLCRSLDLNIESNEDFTRKNGAVQNFTGYGRDCYDMILQQQQKRLVNPLHPHIISEALQHGSRS